MKNKVRAVLGGLLIGALSVGAALAGVITVPLVGGTKTDLPSSADVLKAAAFSSASISGDEEVAPDEVAAVLAETVTAPSGSRTPDGTFLVGAARGSLYPTPAAFGGGTWQTEGCTEIDEGRLNQDHVVPSLADMRGWPAASPDCIYLGGFGIGPARAAHTVDPGGVWIRSIAISNGERTFVYQIADLVGWFSRYDAPVCADCGILDVRKAVAAQTGLTIDDIAAGATHSHAGADMYGGWGGLPSWYRNQIRDTAIASAKQAIANLQPARLYTGEANLRRRNNERRDTYHSNADAGAAWLQARALPDGNGNEATIATLANFAAHPTIVGDPILHADWPGAASRRFEGNYGGVGLMFEGGLGNVSVSGVGGATDSQNAENTGIAIANDIATDISRDSTLLASNNMASSVRLITHPVLTNPGLTSLAAAGFFDREFIPFTDGADGPGAYHWSKRASLSSVEGLKGNPAGGETFRSCDSASPVQIKTYAGAYNIGGVLVAVAPGEIFSNIAEVIKEKADGAIGTLVLGQTNDSLGYIIQSFEYDKLGNAATEYATMTGEYEEVFAIDHCFGDHVLDTVLQSAGEVGLR